MGKRNSTKTQSQRLSIPKPTVKEFPEVHSNGYLAGVDSEKMAPTFSFQHLDDRDECPSCWQKTEIKDLYRAFSLASSMNWKDLRKHSGLRYKKVDAGLCKRTLAENLSEDISLSELRVSSKARIFGVKSNHIYYVIWFDRNHQVLPV